MELRGRFPGQNRVMTFRFRIAALVAALVPTVCAADTVEFCLDGEFDLGARYQGMQPRAGEWSAARWCVVTEDESARVLLRMSGKSNPDMEGSWSVAFLPPDLVRIVNAGSPPDIEFRPAAATADALRTRRMDPRRFVEEARTRSGSIGDEISFDIQDQRLSSVWTTVDLPLRGRVPVVWQWDWADERSPALRISVDGDVVFRAQGAWRVLDEATAAPLWQATMGAEPVQVPGGFWPARSNMELVNLTDGVYLVQTVRTGFQHLVVETGSGLVVADAPAGWVEIQQIPPTDLVPGLGVSGLSEKLVDFLADEFPDKRVRAVALTHFHDDHAGGARAFAAAGADVYAPAAVARFLEEALNRDNMPADRLREMNGNVRIKAVADAVVLDDPDYPVKILPMGNSPHTSSSLGVLANGFFFQSDLHVPNSEADVPRADRSATECWFAGWAVENLPADTLVINTHSRYQTPVSRLARYLDSDSC